DLHIPVDKRAFDDESAEESECDPDFFFPKRIIKEKPEVASFLEGLAIAGSQLANYQLRAAFKGDQPRLDKLPSQQIRPPFVIDVPDVTAEMKKIQRSQPTKWAMTLDQWNEFIDFCKQAPLWQDIKYWKGEGGHVNLYEMVDNFVIPFTQGTGCSVAVLMNKDAPKVAEVMLSHSWAEDMEECQQAVNSHFEAEGIPTNIGGSGCISQKISKAPQSKNTSS
ncbi:unnamed protein product, partial [Polarella glacialis]